MTSATWNYVAGTGANNYNNSLNWSTSNSLPGNIPGANDTAFFGTSNVTSIGDTANLTTVGQWVFNPGAPTYSFSIGSARELDFFGAGIIVNGGRASITDSGLVAFFNNSSAGRAAITITASGHLSFDNSSNGGNANIINNNFLFFVDDSSAGAANITNNFVMEVELSGTLGTAIVTNNKVLGLFDSGSAGSATIHTTAGGKTSFFNNANGGNAQLITDSGGTVDFSQSAGPANDHRLTVGSIAGAGTYDLGADQLTIGSNGLSAAVSGLIDDGGLGSGSGASLVKVGHGTLKLSHAGNTYSGGTTLKAGTLDLAAIGAAGTGAITFTAGPQKLKIENAALSHHVFGNSIDFFGNGDVLDLTGLHFNAGASATYHAASHHLTVHSGSVTDTLTLIGPVTTHFQAVSDGHGGTDLLLHA
jgi:autotransporter-associated beta strand protein